MRWPTLLLSWMTVAALSVVATWLAVFRPVDAPGDDDSEASYPLSLTKYTDARSVSLTIESAPPQQLIARRAGVVTRLDCQVGGAWRAGETPVEIDRRPLLLLAAEAPWHRDLGPGDQGADVSALQTSLAALGHNVAVTGTFDSATVSAWRAAASEAGLPGAEGFQRSDVIWIPDGEVTLHGCPAQLGHDIAADTAVGEIDSRSATIAFQPPADLLEGERVLVLADTQAAVGQNQQIAPADVAALLATPEARAAVQQAAGEPAHVSGIVQLAVPVDVYAAPASAVVRDARGMVCVHSGGTAHPADVISSSLGLTYLRFDGEPPHSVDVFPAPGASCT